MSFASAVQPFVRNNNFYAYSWTNEGKEGNNGGGRSRCGEEKINFENEYNNSNIFMYSIDLFE